MTFDYQAIAEALQSLGLKGIPVSGKEPCKNKGYRDLIGEALVMPDPGKGTPDGVAILCGLKWSSGFVCIDFDLKNGDGVDFFEEWFGLVPQDLQSRLTVARTPSGGYHAYVKIDFEVRSEKLARNAEKKDLIETRGEGGYCIVPPSKGYTLIQNKISTTPKITKEEWDTLISIARCFNDYVPEEHITYVPKGGPVEGDSPLNRYDSEVSPQEILEGLGYRALHSHKTQIHYNRPDARNKNGVDATVYVDQNVIHFWSPVSNASLPDTDRNYKPSQFLVFTQYDGDFSRAAKDLAIKYNMSPVVVGSAENHKPIKPQIIPPVESPNELEKLHREFSHMMDGVLEDYVRKGVNLTEETMDGLRERFVELYEKDGGEFVQYVVKYYRENEEFFNIDNQPNAFKRLEQFITGSFRIKRNVLTFSTVIVNKRTDEPTNYDENSIFNLCKRAGYKVSMQDVKSILNDPRYFSIEDPVEIYFNSLKDRVAKNPNAIHDLAAHITVEDGHEAFWQVMFRKALIRSVAQGIGDYTNREAIVLCHTQERAGKTSFIKFLNPWGPEKYYSDEVIINHKDQMFRICQNFVYLIDEIGSDRYGPKTMDHLKLILSKSSVNERITYAIQNTFMRRKVTFWGTTNLPYLTQGENSRWISIPIKNIDHNYNNYITGVQNIDIDDVWQEAYEAYMAGETYELTVEEREIQSRLNMDWVVGNEAGGLVDTYLGHGEANWKTIEEVMSILENSNQTMARRVNAKNLTEALRSRGFEEKLVNKHGRKIRVFNVKQEFLQA